MNFFFLFFFFLVDEAALMMVPYIYIYIYIYISPTHCRNKDITSTQSCYSRINADFASSAIGLDYIKYNNIKARFCKEIPSGWGNWWLEWETSPQFVYQYLKRDVYFDKGMLAVLMINMKLSSYASLAFTW
jgi:hypothetical protein